MCKPFCYESYNFDEKTGVLSLVYTYDCYTFEEKISFLNTSFSLSEEKRTALDSIFFLTHIAFGISYYKAFCPKKIEIKSGELTKEQAVFFENFYLQGLGEFAIRNNLNLQGTIAFPFTKKKQNCVNLSLKNRFLVPVGGGKDSCVSMEFFKRFNYQASAIAVNNPEPILKCIEKSALDSFILKRTISPKLIELNQTGTVLNGHVPITGMLAFILWISAVLYDYRYVALSCEKSANSSNMMQGTLAINHQYSKSFSFEKDFHAITQSITPAFLYFSLLRPLSEYNIARLFAKYATKYFSVFTSCNKAFRLNKETRLSHWCATCDKCRFVFLILAPFMEKETLVRILGKNPLDDIEQITGYKELLGLEGHKPFECVGEVEECITAFRVLMTKKEWQTDKVIQALAPQVEKLPSLSEYNPFTYEKNNLLPKEIENDFAEFIK